VALQLAASPVTGAGFEHVGLAGSLIAMREGVSLTAYPDPNPDAGMNIGAGYNLKANAATANQDLKRAGVPEDRIEDVKTGRASLTPDQAKRLIEVATPRYESLARKSADDTAPGLWNRMTTQQRAVMVDIAYQVGDPAQFKKAWAALAAGKTQEFSDETRVFYKNRDGQVVEDNRARELRASMLAGVADWNARVSLAAK
jgi:GH24 family phage-related lysozyme (muramidase)